MSTANWSLPASVRSRGAGRVAEQGCGAVNTYQPFPRFATGFVAVSERRLDLRSCPNVRPALLVSGSLVFPRGTARAG
jgi:hypothetical protein